jgi:hypothetical protein
MGEGRDSNEAYIRRLRLKMRRPQLSEEWQKNAALKTREEVSGQR